MAIFATVNSPPATTATEQIEVRHDIKPTVEIAASHGSNADNHGGAPSQPTTSTSGMDTATTTAYDSTSAAAADPTGDAVASRGAAAADSPSIILPINGGADGSKDEVPAAAAPARAPAAAAPSAGKERDIQDGCQSSAERNIWSFFNPMWNVFVVNKARLPKKADRGADWAGTVGRPEGLHMFLGTKNPVNRK